MFRYVIKIEFIPEAQDHGEGVLRLTYDDGKTYKYQCARAVADAFAEELKKTI